MTTRKVNIVKSADWVTIILYLMLTLMGWFNIYAAVYNDEYSNIFDFSQRYGKQLVWIGFALLIAFLLFVVDNKAYHFFAYFIYATVVVVLLNVLFFGKEVNGARAWFEIGPVGLQPAEFGKFATGLAIARFLSSFNIKIHKFENLFILGAVILTPVILIIFQNDVGSAIVYVAFVLVLFREGLTPWVLLVGVVILVLFFVSLLAQPITVLIALYFFSAILYRLNNNKALREITIATGIISAIGLIMWIVVYFFKLKISLYTVLIISLVLAGIYFLYYAYKKNLKVVLFIIAFFAGSIFFSFSVDYVFNNILQPHQQKRINVLLNKDVDVKSAGYNVHQSKIAIGSGGFYGKGYLKGTQTKFNFVPEQSTDFIFCTVGEEWGFIGSVTVLLLFVFLILRIIYMAERQRSSFGRIYGYSVASILFIHVAVNIGMTIGLSPVIGIPLPFFSYGGSSLWAFTVLLFIFVRLDASRMELF
jgi:rod shape determining protein RodA